MINLCHRESRVGGGIGRRKIFHIVDITWVPMTPTLTLGKRISKGNDGNSTTTFLQRVITSITGSPPYWYPRSTIPYPSLTLTWILVIWTILQHCIALHRPLLWIGISSLVLGKCIQLFVSPFPFFFVQGRWPRDYKIYKE